MVDAFASRLQWHLMACICNNCSNLATERRGAAGAPVRLQAQSVQRSACANSLFNGGHSLPPVIPPPHDEVREAAHSTQLRLCRRPILGMGLLQSDSAPQYSMSVDHLCTMLCVPLPDISSGVAHTAVQLLQACRGLTAFPVLRRICVNLVPISLQCSLLAQIAYSGTMTT